MFCEFIQHEGYIECVKCRRTLRRDGTHRVRVCRIPTNKTEKPPGLGDRIESALTSLGITKDRVEAWVGGPCGCEERQQKLNALGEWAASAVDRGKAWGLARLRELVGVEINAQGDNQ